MAEKKPGNEMLELEGFAYAHSYTQVDIKSYRYMYVCPPRGTRTNDIPMATGTSSTQILVPKYCTPLPDAKAL